MQGAAKRQILVLFFLSIHFFVYTETVVFFSPDDKPTTHLIAKIRNAKIRIHAAVYMLTDKRIAQALIKAKQRNVDVQIITDYSSVKSEYGKIIMLKENHIPTFVFQIPNKSRFTPLMHNKFAIIDNHVWTGSFNWTVSANQQNQENVIYTDEAAVLERYVEQFETLKSRCVIHTSPCCVCGKPKEPASTTQVFYGPICFLGRLLRRVFYA
jgi:phosphatidylserine/phosphatidylglycerophosphate/cardiolipin synthase-like enzyme